MTGESNKKKDIWFPAKAYGYGWGMPCAWQGWVVMIAWIAVLSSGMSLIILLSRPDSDAPRPLVSAVGLPVFLAVMVLSLVAVCRAKGERARWRWGRKKDECWHCGYDLTGNVSGVCPECGEKTQPTHRPDERSGA